MVLYGRSKASCWVAADDHVGVERPLRLKRKGTVPPSIVSRTKSWRETLITSLGQSPSKEGLGSIMPLRQNHD
jgi:hypothetical protein